MCSATYTRVEISVVCCTPAVNRQSLIIVVAYVSFFLPPHFFPSTSTLPPLPQHTTSLLLTEGRQAGCTSFLALAAFIVRSVIVGGQPNSHT